MDSTKPVRWPFVVMLLVIATAAMLALSMDKVPDPTPNESVTPTKEQKADFIRQAEKYFCEEVKQISSVRGEFHVCVGKQFTEGRRVRTCEQGVRAQKLREACLAAPAVWTSAFLTYSGLVTMWESLCEVYTAKEAAEYLREAYTEQEINKRIEVGLIPPEGLPSQLPAIVLWDGVHDHWPCSKFHDGQPKGQPA